MDTGLVEWKEVSHQGRQTGIRLERFNDLKTAFGTDHCGLVTPTLNMKRGVGWRDIFDFDWKFTISAPLNFIRFLFLFFCFSTSHIIPIQ